MKYEIAKSREQNSGWKNKHNENEYTKLLDVSNCDIDHNE